LLFVLVATVEEGIFVEVLFVSIDDDELVEYVARICTKYIVSQSIETSPRGLMD
jgi:hypothetical protein